MTKYLILTAIGCGLAAMKWRKPQLPRRLRRRYKCIICGISTDDPIRYDGRVFNDETCRAQYEADKGRFHEKWWMETGKEELGF